MADIGPEPSAETPQKNPHRLFIRKEDGRHVWMHLDSLSSHDIVQHVPDSRVETCHGTEEEFNNHIQRLLADGFEEWGVRK